MIPLEHLIMNRLDQVPLMDEKRDGSAMGTANTDEDRARWQRSLRIVFGIACFSTLLVWLVRRSALPRAADPGPVDWQPCEEDPEILCGFLV